MLANIDDQPLHALAHVLLIDIEGNAGLVAQVVHNYHRDRTELDHQAGFECLMHQQQPYQY